MWGICLDSKAWKDGLFQTVVQYKTDNSKALVILPKANYELDIKRIKVFLSQVASQLCLEKKKEAVCTNLLVEKLLYEYY